MDSANQSSSSNLFRKHAYEQKSGSSALIRHQSGKQSTNDTNSTSMSSAVFKQPFNKFHDNLSSELRKRAGLQESQIAEPSMFSLRPDDFESSKFQISGFSKVQNQEDCGNEANSDVDKNNRSVLSTLDNSKSGSSHWNKQLGVPFQSELIKHHQTSSNSSLPHKQLGMMMNKIPRQWQVPNVQTESSMIPAMRTDIKRTEAAMDSERNIFNKSSSGQPNGDAADKTNTSAIISRNDRPRKILKATRRRALVDVTNLPSKPQEATGACLRGGLPTQQTPFNNQASVQSDTDLTATKSSIFTKELRKANF